MARKKKGRGFHGKAISQAQAGLFGIVAAGKCRKLRKNGRICKSLSKAKAREKLRGVKVSRLPKRVRRRK